MTELHGNFIFRWKFRAKPKGPMYILQLFLVTFTCIYINVYNFGLIVCFTRQRFGYKDVSVAYILDRRDDQCKVEEGGGGHGL